MIIKKTWTDGAVSHFVSPHRTFLDFVNENINDRPGDTSIDASEEKLIIEFEGVESRAKITFEPVIVTYESVCPVMA